MSERDPFAGLEPPAPPDGLRDAALGAARAAFATATAAAHGVDPWTRLARSPAARLAWAASVAALVAGHVLLPGRPSAAPRAVAASPAPAAAADPEVKAIASLPRIDDRALAAREGARS